MHDTQHKVYCGDRVAFPFVFTGSFETESFFYENWGGSLAPIAPLFFLTGYCKEQSLSQITNSAFDISRLDEIKAFPDRFRLLEQVPLTLETQSFPITLSECEDRPYRFVLVDVETTGLKHQEDKLIELGLVVGKISLATNRIVEITEVLNFYEDPGFPIPEEVTALTGITDEMVRGKSIDEDEIARVFGTSAMIIAHNAGFDRPFFEKRIELSGNDKLQHLLGYPWLCSLNDIPWVDLGFKRSRSLEVLLLEQGFFYQAHRASVDALATSWLLHINPEALEQLLHTARQPSAKIRAFGAPFEVKDSLKERGYQWDADGKVWSTIVRSAQAETDELAYLDSLFRNGAQKALVEKFTARTRYKAS